MELNYRILISFKRFFYCLYKWLIKLASNCFFVIQSVLVINVKSPIRKFLVLTNQSSSAILTYFAFYLYSCKKWNAGLFVHRYWFFWFFYFYFQSRLRFHGKKDSPVEKVVIDDEELDDIEIDNILDLENLLEQCASFESIHWWRRAY